MRAGAVLRLACAAAIVAAPGRPAAQQPLFTFHSNAWLNLHHLLWVRNERVAPPADMSDAERTAWNDGRSSYAPYRTRNLLFDRDLLEIKEALRTAEAATSLDGGAIHAGVRATLERVMPIYRKHWWPAHDRTNREWIAAAERLVARHGAALDAAMARAYDVTPDHPVWVDVAVYAHPLGAYTTEKPTHVMIASTDPGYGGYAALEMLFHERSHAWDQRLSEGVAECATKQGVEVPPQLWHAVLFYTAGALTARELKSHGIAYIHFAERGVYDRLCGTGCSAKLAAHWQPYLDGGPTRPEALAALVASFK
jgi:hypothetical protein